MTPRDKALQQLTDLHQRQVVETLADMQALPDDHPIWGVVALLGAVISKPGEGSDVQAALAATAHLNAQMPRFLERLEEVLRSTQLTLETISSRLARLESRLQS
jgi:hypothetical protein